RSATASGVVPFQTSVKRNEVVYLQALNAQPQRWAKALDGINGHQVAARKRLKSHDEQLMPIILVVDRYNTSNIETVDS
ncbi:hypothetical protein L195_g053112, partial [Trifolium pratense]